MLNVKIKKVRPDELFTICVPEELLIELASMVDKSNLTFHTSCRVSDDRGLRCLLFIERCSE